ncbi:MAG: GTPase domain-containing protein [Promethearchaeota archaeon]
MSFTTEIKTVNKPTELVNRVNVTKLLLMGPANAGKTVFGKKIEEAFNGVKKKKNASNLDPICELYIPTPGIDFYRVLMQGDSQSYVLWELGGQVHYQPLWSIWWKGAKGVFVVIDSTVITESYLAKVQDIIELIRSGLSLPFVLCLNKIDLLKCNTNVLENISKYLAIDEDKIIPCSAVTGLNVRNTLYYLLELI